jgi:mRNA-degrading endonuclease YafQ of YafQ-DinJ toxin-antitoxin module
MGRIALSFKEFLNEDYGRPYYYSSAAYIHTRKKFPSNIETLVRERMLEFRELKTFDPRILISSPGWKDHKLKGVLSDYFDAHVIYGKLVLIYYHGGEYIILMDIVPHDDVDSPQKATVLARRLAPILTQLKPIVERKVIEIKKLRGDI